jgi:hypothetical protein
VLDGRVANWLPSVEPDDDGAPVTDGTGSPVWDGWRPTDFMTAIFAVGCVQATHAFYYGFGHASEGAGSPRMSPAR